MSAVLAWRRERLSIPLFGTLSVYLCLAASGGAELSLLLLTCQVLAAWCLVAAFRIWDDIADRPRDAVATPRRVMVGVTDLRPFWAVSVTLLALGALGTFAFTGWFGPLLVGGLAICFGVLYHIGLGHREHWVLLKYPLMVTALGAQSWTAPVLVYLSFSVYERIEDPALREAQGASLHLIPYLVGVGAVTFAAIGDSWWWLGLWTLTAAVSVFALVGKRPMLAPAFFVFSIFVFQGSSHV